MQSGEARHSGLYGLFSQSLTGGRGEWAVGLQLVELHHGTVALFFVQLYFLHQLAAADDDFVEYLPHDGGFRGEGELPLPGIAGKGEVEVALQFGGVAAEYGHEKFYLCGLCGLAAVGAPLALCVLAADAVAADAQFHVKRFLQMPKQAVAGAQGEVAAGLYGFVH